MNYQFHWMSLFILISGMCWIIITRQSSGPTIVVAPGFPLPELTYTTTTGSLVNPSSHGRARILTLWASWCPPCRAEIPVLAAIAPSLALHGVDVVLVNQGESPSDTQQFLIDQHINMPVWYDRQGLLATAVASRDLPTTVFVDESGIVRLVYRGPVAPDVLLSIAVTLKNRGHP